MQGDKNRDTLKIAPYDTIDENQREYLVGKILIFNLFATKQNKTVPED